MHKSKSQVRKKRVLVIDDDEFLCRMMEQCLGADYEVECTERATVGIIRFEEAAKSEKPFDLVISDLSPSVSDPHLDGYDVYAALQEVQSDCKVLIMTGGASGKKAQFALGQLSRLCVPVLWKPFMIEELRAIVSRLVA